MKLYGIFVSGRWILVLYVLLVMVKYGEYFVKWIRKKVLKLNVIYKIKEGYMYIIDNYGRIISVKVDL